MFWVRLHPMMLNEREAVRAALGDAARFVLDEPTDLPLHALFPLVEVHLTHSSSTVIEAAQSGIRSVISSAWGAELYSEYTRSGFAEVADGDADQVLDALLRLTRRAHSQVSVGCDIDEALDQLLPGLCT